MISDRAFQVTLFVSAALHVVILSRNNILTDPAAKNIKTTQKIQEVNYLKLVEKDFAQAKAPLMEMPPNLPSRIAAAKRMPPPFFDQESALVNSAGSVLNQKSFFAPAVLNKPEIKPDIIAVKKKITLPQVDIDKINNPSYLSYYQIVREKIRRSAYQNYSASDTGEVYISFIVSSAGYLEEARLVEDKSSAKAYLREIAIKSVNDASPFPKFPTELNYSQLSFNVIISFEIE